MPRSLHTHYTRPWYRHEGNWRFYNKHSSLLFCDSVSPFFFLRRPTTLTFSTLIYLRTCSLIHSFTRSRSFIPSFQKHIYTYTHTHTHTHSFINTEISVFTHLLHSALWPHEHTYIHTHYQKRNQNKTILLYGVFKRIGYNGSESDSGKKGTGKQGISSWRFKDFFFLSAWGG